MGYILYGVDGTGDMSDASYQRDMMHSFVRRIVWHAPIPGRQKQYHRGPDWSGMQVIDEASYGYSFIKRTLSALPGSLVLLTGYSRGGAAVITLAQMLQGDRIPVWGMMLFDAVERATNVNCDTIPRNVSNVCHARRDVYASFSRVSFGNCGTRAVPPTTYVERRFRCTHGAMGGTPWTGGSDGDRIDELDVTGRTFVTYGEDRAMSPQVWSWADPWLRRFGFL